LQRQVRQLWESKYKPVDTISRPDISDGATSPTADQLASKPTCKPVNQYTAYLQKFKVKALAQADDTASRDDEYSRYIKERVEWVEDPIAWWLLQKHRYPNLRQMALDILSIPCMSADVERLFSSCGLTLEDRRNRMGSELLEALECLKSWQKIRGFNILESLVGSESKV
jgi:hypothetical protein